MDQAEFVSRTDPIIEEYIRLYPGWRGDCAAIFAFTDDGQKVKYQPAEEAMRHCADVLDTVTAIRVALKECPETYGVMYFVEAAICTIKVKDKSEIAEKMKTLGDGPPPDASPTLMIIRETRDGYSHLRCFEVHRHDNKCTLKPHDLVDKTENLPFYTFKEDKEDERPRWKKVKSP